MKMIKNYLIKKLGGYTKEDFENKVEDEVLELSRKFAHNIHYPEYIDKNGKRHLHQCPLGNWKDDEKEWCKPVPFERNKDGVLTNIK